MIHSATYRLFVKGTALLLLIGMTLPAGLCAKQLMDFCHTEVTEHSANMQAGHDDCPTNTQSTDTHEKESHDCEDEDNCVCHINLTQNRDQNWITPNNLIINGAFTDLTSISTVSYSNSYRYPYNPPDPYSTPPFFLLNSTFLN